MKFLRLLLIVLPFVGIIISFYSCGGGGGTSSGSTNSSTSVTLTWDAPTTNVDGTPLTDLAGYKIYYGKLSGKYTNVIDVGNVITYKVEDLQSGTYYFAVTAYDTSANEGDYSNEVSKSID
jgi:hypothetical protein